jgi:hypothetical protein
MGLSLTIAAPEKKKIPENQKIIEIVIKILVVERFL